ncbi:MAG: hypothetical protein FWC47_03945 [Oscillospiraceae bacterium]|nr:hypothetical protein [Oscillospiraceae bacterium]
MSKKSRKNKANYVSDIKETIENTKENIEFSDLSFDAEHDENIRHDIDSKNERREEAIELMQDKLEEQ